MEPMCGESGNERPLSRATPEETIGARRTLIDETSAREQGRPVNAAVLPTVTSLHAWLKAHDYHYFSINSVPRLGPLDPLLDRVRPLGIARRQLFRLCPFNCRSLLGAESVEDPEATILLAKAYGKLYRTYGETFHAPREVCWQRLQHLGDGGGDDLFTIPQRRRLHTLYYSAVQSDVSPLLTAWAGSAFLERYAEAKEAEFLQGAARVAAYFLYHHPKDVSEEGVYFYYTPQLRKRIFNASAEMSAFLVEYGLLSGDRKATDLGWRGIQFLLHHQSADGSWLFGEGRIGRYIDNFHTAFILLALSRVMRLTPDPALGTGLARGLRYYVSHLFQKERDGLRPVRYDRRYWPLNSTLLQRADLRDCALALILFSHQAEHDPLYQDMADDVLLWTLARMRRRSWFHPEILAYGRNWNPYISFQAWMLLGLATMGQSLY